ncbi:probable F-box protein At4g22030 [Ricinus communis]|uniref:F-box protein n=1 Tax=Ricinus communis TaxID=3988 RepID=B9RXI0_RICCO|nr:probable F-box protein At4g22030 [Ricinus communis]EEF43836.1 conserved hypothetical protein [Ricinus communis]|eukprot:XP_002518449.1 probable F-box protein At4g22030 [Ricinus communis]
MTTLQTSSTLLAGISSSPCCCRRTARAATNVPKIRIGPLFSPKLSNLGLMEELSLKDCRIPTTTPMEKDPISGLNFNNSSSNSDPMVISKLYAIMEIVADRVEMHKNIGEQRDNWNRLLLTSTNAIILTAATMSGLAATSPFMKVSSTILYLAATGLLAMMNSIQPSQLAEEQRNATRLCKQLHHHIREMLTIGNFNINDVNEAVEKILAIDRAYPLPLLGAMLEKFPSSVEPAVWWLQPKQKQAIGLARMTHGNGWNGELEDELRKIVQILKGRDKADYLKLGKQALKVNKILAITGPVLTGVGALGSAFVGTNPLSVIVGVISGALASIINSIEHGGQIGMVFEMYRSNAGFFKLMEETIESNVRERMVEGRENGELLEIKVALQLGRSLSELKHLAESSPSRNGVDTEEFASELF